MSIYFTKTVAISHFMSYIVFSRLK